MPLPRTLTTLALLATPLAVGTTLIGPVPAGAAAPPTAALAPAATRVAAKPWPGHPDRSIVVHTVRRGDTAGALAVRYHAWTRELVALNHLRGGHIYVGQRLRVPVVVSAVRKAKSSTSTPKRAPKTAPKKTAPKKTATKVSRPLLRHASTPPRGWRHADLSRSQVRDLVVRTARASGVPPKLALAVAWQESGWQQRRVSSAGAIGVMQVLPSTGRWMRLYVGRTLRIRDTHDNVLTGVMTLKVLLGSTRIDNRAIGAYYQGLGAVREHGLYDSTRLYVRAVRAHEARIGRTGSPV